MDSIDREALTGLTNAFEALLPPVAAPQLPSELALDPVRSGPAGIGGLVGLSREPPGEIVGRRMHALARVRVRTSDASRLDEAVTGLTAAVVAGDRAQQRSAGLLEAELVEIGPEAASTGNGGQRFARDVRFRVLYEHLRLPEAGEGIIEEIPLDIEQGAPEPPAGPGEIAVPPAVAPRRVETRPALTLADFEAVDDPRATRDAPSAWSFDAAGGRFLQTSPIWGGVRTVSVNKPGTYLVLRPGTGRGPFAGVRFEARLGSEGTGGIGVVFRYQDADNFYFVLLQRDRDFRLLGRKAGGSFGSLGAAAVQRDRSYTPGVAHRLVVTAQGDRVEAAVDGDPPLSAQDRSLSAPGRVGFLCHREPRAFFFVGELSEL